VNASALGWPVEIHTGPCPRAGLRPDPGAIRIVIRQDRHIVAEHRRSYSHGETI
jgi:hypothetical protein